MPKSIAELQEEIKTEKLRQLQLLSELQEELLDGTEEEKQIYS